MKPLDFTNSLEQAYAEHKELSIPKLLTETFTVSVWSGSLLSRRSLLGRISHWLQYRGERRQNLKRISHYLQKHFKHIKIAKADLRQRLQSYVAEGDLPAQVPGLDAVSSTAQLAELSQAKARKAQQERASWRSKSLLRHGPDAEDGEAVNKALLNTLFGFEKPDLDMRDAYRDAYLQRLGLASDSQVCTFLGKARACGGAMRKALEPCNDKSESEQVAEQADKLYQDLSNCGMQTFLLCGQYGERVNTFSPVMALLGLEQALPDDAVDTLPSWVQDVVKSGRLPDPELFVKNQLGTLFNEQRDSRSAPAAHFDRVVGTLSHRSDGAKRFFSRLLPKSWVEKADIVWQQSLASVIGHGSAALSPVLKQRVSLGGQVSQALGWIFRKVHRYGGYVSSVQSRDELQNQFINFAASIVSGEAHQVATLERWLAHQQQNIQKNFPVDIPAALGIRGLSPGGLAWIQIVPVDDEHVDVELYSLGQGLRHHTHDSLSGKVVWPLRFPRISRSLLTRDFCHRLVQIQSAAHKSGELSLPVDDLYVLLKESLCYPPLDLSYSIDEKLVDADPYDDLFLELSGLTDAREMPTLMLCFKMRLSALVRYMQYEGRLSGLSKKDLGIVKRCRQELERMFLSVQSQMESSERERLEATFQDLSDLIDGHLDPDGALICRLKDELEPAAPAAEPYSAQALLERYSRAIDRYIRDLELHQRLDHTDLQYLKELRNTCEIKAEKSADESVASDWRVLVRDLAEVIELAEASELERVSSRIRAASRSSLAKIGLTREVLSAIRELVCYVVGDELADLVDEITDELKVFFPRTSEEAPEEELTVSLFLLTHMWTIFNALRTAYMLYGYYHNDGKALKRWIMWTVLLQGPRYLPDNVKAWLYRIIGACLRSILSGLRTAGSLAAKTSGPGYRAYLWSRRSAEQIRRMAEELRGADHEIDPALEPGATSYRQEPLDLADMSLDGLLEGLSPIAAEGAEPLRLALDNKSFPTTPPAHELSDRLQAALEHQRQLSGWNRHLYIMETLRSLPIPGGDGSAYWEQVESQQIEPVIDALTSLSMEAAASYADMRITFERLDGQGVQVYDKDFTSGRLHDQLIAMQYTALAQASCLASRDPELGLVDRYKIKPLELYFFMQKQRAASQEIGGETAPYQSHEFWTRMHAVCAFFEIDLDRPISVEQARKLSKNYLFSYMHLEYSEESSEAALAAAVRSDPAVQTALKDVESSVSISALIRQLRSKRPCLGASASERRHTLLNQDALDAQLAGLTPLQQAVFSACLHYSLRPSRAPYDYNTAGRRAARTLQEMNFVDELLSKEQVAQKIAANPALSALSQKPGALEAYLAWGNDELLPKTWRLLRWQALLSQQLIMAEPVHTEWQESASSAKEAAKSDLTLHRSYSNSTGTLSVTAVSKGSQTHYLVGPDAERCSEDQLSEQQRDLVNDRSKLQSEWLSYRDPMGISRELVLVSRPVARAAHALAQVATDRAMQLAELAGARLCSLPRSFRLGSCMLQPIFDLDDSLKFCSPKGQSYLHAASAFAKLRAAKNPGTLLKKLLPALCRVDLLKDLHKDSPKAVQAFIHAYADLLQYAADDELLLPLLELGRTLYTPLKQLEPELNWSLREACQRLSAASRIRERALIATLPWPEQSHSDVIAIVKYLHASNQGAAFHYAESDPIAAWADYEIRRKLWKLRSSLQSLLLDAAACLELVKELDPAAAELEAGAVRLDGQYLVYQVDQQQKAIDLQFLRTLTGGRPQPGMQVGSDHWVRHRAGTLPDNLLPEQDDFGALYRNFDDKRFKLWTPANLHSDHATVWVEESPNGEERQVRAFRMGHEERYWIRSKRGRLVKVAEWIDGERLSFAGTAKHHPKLGFLSRIFPLESARCYANAETGSLRKIKTHDLTLSVGIDSRIYPSIEGLEGYYISPKQSHPALRGLANALVVQNEAGKIRVILRKGQWKAGLGWRSARLLGSLAPLALSAFEGMGIDGNEALRVYELSDDGVLISSDPQSMTEALLFYLASGKTRKALEACSHVESLIQSETLNEKQISQLENSFMQMGANPLPDHLFGTVRLRLFAATERARQLNPQLSKSARLSSIKRPSGATGLAVALILKELKTLSEKPGANREITEESEWLLYCRLERYLDDMRYSYGRDAALSSGSGNGWSAKWWFRAIDWLGTRNFLEIGLLHGALSSRYGSLRKKYEKNRSWRSSALRMGRELVYDGRMRSDIVANTIEAAHEKGGKFLPKGGTWSAVGHAAGEYSSVWNPLRSQAELGGLWESARAQESSYDPSVRPKQLARYLDLFRTSQQPVDAQQLQQDAEALTEEQFLNKLPTLYAAVAADPSDFPDTRELQRQISEHQRLVKLHREQAAASKKLADEESEYEAEHLEGAQVASERARTHSKRESELIRALYQTIDARKRLGRGQLLNSSENWSPQSSTLRWMLLRIAEFDADNRELRYLPSAAQLREGGKTLCQSTAEQIKTLVLTSKMDPLPGDGLITGLITSVRKRLSDDTAFPAQTCMTGLTLRSLSPERFMSSLIDFYGIAIGEGSNGQQAALLELLKRVPSGWNRETAYYVRLLTTLLEYKTLRSKTRSFPASSEFRHAALEHGPQSDEWKALCHRLEAQLQSIVRTGAIAELAIAGIGELSPWVARRALVAALPFGSLINLANWGSFGLGLGERLWRAGKQMSSDLTLKSASPHKLEAPDLPDRLDAQINELFMMVRIADSLEAAQSLAEQLHIAARRQIDEEIDALLLELNRERAYNPVLGGDQKISEALLDKLFRDGAFASQSAMLGLSSEQAALLDKTWAGISYKRARLDRQLKQVLKQLGASSEDSWKDDLPACAESHLGWLLNQHTASPSEQRIELVAAKNMGFEATPERTLILQTAEKLSRGQLTVNLWPEETSENAIRLFSARLRKSVHVESKRLRLSVTRQPHSAQLEALLQLVRSAKEQRQVLQVTQSDVLAMESYMLAALEIGLEHDSKRTLAAVADTIVPQNWDRFGGAEGVFLAMRELLAAIDQDPIAMGAQRQLPAVKLVIDGRQQLKLANREQLRGLLACQDMASARKAYSKMRQIFLEPSQHVEHSNLWAKPSYTPWLAYIDYCSTDWLLSGPYAPPEQEDNCPIVSLRKAFRKSASAALIAARKKIDRRIFVTNNFLPVTKTDYWQSTVRVAEKGQQELENLLIYVKKGRDGYGIVAMGALSSQDTEFFIKQLKETQTESDVVPVVWNLQLNCQVGGSEIDGETMRQSPEYKELVSQLYLTHGSAVNASDQEAFERYIVAEGLQLALEAIQERKGRA